MSSVIDIERQVDILSELRAPGLQTIRTEAFGTTPFFMTSKTVISMGPNEQDMATQGGAFPIVVSGPTQLAQEVGEERSVAERKLGTFSSRVRRMGIVAGTLLVASVLGNGGLAQADTANALVRGAISDNPDGISTITPPGSRRLELQNVDSLGDVLRKFRLSYLQNCTYSMSQNQFKASLSSLASGSNENARMLNAVDRIRSGKMFLWQRTLKGLRKDSTFSLDIPRCRRPAWEAYVNIGLSRGESLDEEVEEARIKSGCQGVTPSFYKDQVWYMNPTHQDDGDVVNFSWNVLPGPFEVPITVPICARVNKFSPQDTPGPYSRWMRTGRPVEPNNSYLMD